jgi:beta-carotene hydroxylase
MATHTHPIHRSQGKGRDHSHLQPTAPLPPLHAIAKDLLHTSTLRRLWVLSRPFLFLIGYVLVAALVSPYAGIPFLLALFVANICAAHDVVHNALRLKGRATHVLLALYGILVMQSGHSFRITHLSHHATYPSPHDPEGVASHGGFWHALAMGPFYVPKLWLWAMRRAKKQPVERAWMIVEATIAFLIYMAVILLIPFTLAPLIYIVIMTIGTWLYPIVTSYLPHNHMGEDEIHQSRSIHGKVLPYLALGLTYHLEHHLYPRVPAHHMKELSKRLLPLLKEHNAELIQVP